jgi:TolA-binding protein
VLTHGSGKSSQVTVVRKDTLQGSTVEKTVTVSTTAPAATNPPAPPPPPSTPVPSGGSGHSLNDQGYAKMRAGDYAGALPLLQAAVQKLSGTGPGDPYEAYANYNLGYTLLQLGRCDAAIGYLKTAQRLEPGRPEPRDQAKRARDCAKGK